MLRTAASALLITACLASSAAAEVPRPGSVLVFPVHRTAGSAYTIVGVTNTNTQPQTPFSFGGSTRLHYQYANVNANPLNELEPFGCVITNAGEFLTPADTFSINTDCHNAGSATGKAGFLVVSAMDPAGGPWSHNHLVGSELVVTQNGGMYSLNAIPFSAKTPAGSPTDMNFNGRLDFDDVEYEAIPDYLFLDVFVASTNSSLSLLSLTGGSSAVHQVALSVWNDNEVPLSATFSFRCWFDVPLRKVAPLFTQDFLANSTNDDPEELDWDCTGVGRFESGWVRIQSVGVTSTGGFPIATDGALLGAVTTHVRSAFDGGRVLWGSEAKQFNGRAFEP